MKKSILLLSLMLAFVLGSCSKYEDGPKFSLLTKKSRLANDWVLKKVINSDGSVSNSDGNTKLHIDKDGTAQLAVTFSGVTTTTNGTWDFSSNKENVTFIYKNGVTTSTEEYQILRLKSKELWMKELNESDNSELHFEQAD